MFTSKYDSINFRYTISNTVTQKGVSLMHVGKETAKFLDEVLSVANGESDVCPECHGNKVVPESVFSTKHVPCPLCGDPIFGDKE